MTIRKKDLIRRVRETTAKDKSTISKIVNAFLREINRAILEGERIEIRNWGVYEVYWSKKTKRHNPITGERIEVYPAKKVRFKLSRKMKEALNAKSKTS